jgi:hypothetical protein
MALTRQYSMENYLIFGLKTISPTMDLSSNSKTLKPLSSKVAITASI